MIMNIHNTLKGFISYVFSGPTIQHKHVAYAQIWHDLSIAAAKQRLEYIQSGQKLYGHQAAEKCFRLALKYSILYDYCLARRDAAIEKGIS